MEFIKAINALQTPKIIAISGYGGAGKSTLAKKISKEINAPIVCVDSFAKDSQLQDFSLWNLMDYQRLTDEVILPFKQRSTAFSYGDFDWERNKITQHISITQCDTLIIEGVGLFRPELIAYFDYKIWIDTLLEKAIEQGKKRDKAQYNKSLDEYWDGIWKQNDIECFEAFQPLKVTDFIYTI